MSPKRFEEFGLNAFKGMGGIFAVGQVICRKLGIDPQKASYELLTSPGNTGKDKGHGFYNDDRRQSRKGSGMGRPYVRLPFICIYAKGIG